VERPAEWWAAAAIVALCTVSVLPRGTLARVALALAAAAAGLAIALDTSLLHPRAALDELWRGLVTFYEVTLPFVPARDPEMASLVLAAVLGLALCAAQLAAAGWTLPAAVVAAAGAAWPATLLGGEGLAYGALALGAVLWLLVVARARRLHALVAASVGAIAVVAVAVAAASTGAGATDAQLQWQRWNLFRDQTARVAVSYVWDANYDGISFPADATEVLRVRSDRRSHYWRASSLDLFWGDRWLEDLRPLGRAQGRAVLPRDALTPPRARRRQDWLEQRVQIGGLRDARLVAAGTPVAYDVSARGGAFLAEGGLLRVPVGLRRGDRYDVWSYVPDPVPGVLGRLRPVYPAALEPYLRLFGEQLPRFGARGREAVVRRLVHDPLRSGFDYAPVYERARALAAAERSPYRVVLALESWLRSKGGFRYDERPPAVPGVPPLVAFVTRTKAGYCQHFAGAMTLMLRLLGIPSRVAVGFTSGSYRDGAWIVTDHDAHAWVEVWFPRYGWIPFDPTPGRGRLSGAYSFASESALAVAELGAGRLPGPDEVARLAEVPAAASSRGGGAPPVTAMLAALALGALVTPAVAKAVRRRLRYLPRDPRRRAGAARAELVDFLRDQGHDVGPCSTVSDLEAAVSAAYGVRLSRFSDAVGRARFALQPVPADAARARVELRRALGAVRTRLGPWRRARGLVSLRSLRRG
jgi:transglutaminase-like putative cysteine protease